MDYPPVEYSNLKIRGKQAKFSSMFEEGNEKLQKALSPEMEFEEDDDFWEHLSFDVTNVSNKTIVYLQTNINLYSKEVIQKYSAKEQVLSANNEDVAILEIEFGDSSNLNPPNKESLQPGESKTLTIDPYMRDFVRQKVQSFSSPIVRIGIFASAIFFADGSSWTFSGRVSPPTLKDKRSSLRGVNHIRQISSIMAIKAKSAVTA